MYRRLIKCRECGQCRTVGIDPVTKKEWQQCGCDPYPASLRRIGGKLVIVSADATPDEISEFCAEPPEPLPPSKQHLREKTESAHIVCNGHEVFLGAEIFLRMDAFEFGKKEPRNRKIVIPMVKSR